MIVLDTSVLIAFLDEQDAHHDRAVDLLDREAADDLAISALTWAEVLVAPVRRGVGAAAVRVVAELEISVVAVSGDDAGGLADLRATSGLRMPDCCVVLPAVNAGARVATFDRRLAAAARGLGLDVLAE